ncbi:MAG: hypothetical protein RIM72_06170 [Alphaproteobacteria bacterium]
MVKKTASKKASKVAKKSTSKKASAKHSKTEPLYPDEIAFDFIKSNYFRVIPVEGAFGGISASGRGIHMAVYSERRALPKQVVHDVSADGQILEEKREKRTTRDAIVREVEIDMVMDLPTAISLRDWLEAKILELNKAGVVMIADQKKTDKND